MNDQTLTDRQTRVLDFLRSRPGPVEAREVAEALSISNATKAYKGLHALEAMGLVRRDSSAYPSRWGVAPGAEVTVRRIVSKGDSAARSAAGGPGGVLMASPRWVILATDRHRTGQGVRAVTECGRHLFDETRNFRFARFRTEEGARDWLDKNRLRLNGVDYVYTITTL